MEGCRISSKETSEEKQAPCKFVDWVKYVLPLRCREMESPFVKRFKPEKALRLLKQMGASPGMASMKSWLSWEYVWVSIPCTSLCTQLTMTMSDGIFLRGVWSLFSGCHPLCYHLVPSLSLNHTGFGWLPLLPICLYLWKQSAPALHSSPEKNKKKLQLYTNFYHVSSIRFQMDSYGSP